MMQNLKVFCRHSNLRSLREVTSANARRNLCSENNLSSQDPLPELPSKEKRKIEKTINQVSLLGRVGTEPLKRGSPESPVVVFSLATHNNYRYENGEIQEKTDWHRVCVFKPSLRDLVFSYMKKGQRVYVNGKITYGSVTENGALKSTTSIIADEVIFFYQLDS